MAKKSELFSFPDWPRKPNSVDGLHKNSCPKYLKCKIFTKLPGVKPLLHIYKRKVLLVPSCSQFRTRLFRLHCYRIKLNNYDKPA